MSANIPEKTSGTVRRLCSEHGGVIHTAQAIKGLYRERKKLNVDALMRYAAIDRVQNVMRPYLEAVL